MLGCVPNAQRSSSGKEEDVAMKRHAAGRRSLLVVLVLVAAACVDEPNGPSDGAAITTPPSSTVADQLPAPVVDDLATLPVREGPREKTTESVPHVQLDAMPVPEVDAELRRRAFAIPGVEDRPSEISLAGARALWLSADLELERPEVLLSGREFAHIHPDGSLHVWLPVEWAVDVDETGWGELHPWVDRAGFWDGVVMVFTPRTPAEVDVVIRLLVESHRFVSGLDLDPSEF